jgi:hypothetical protein
MKRAQTTTTTTTRQLLKVNHLKGNERLNVN